MKPKKIHVHKVLELFSNSNENYTIEQLKEKIENEFGKDLKFETCANDSFDLDEIIEFMKKKGKIIIQEDSTIKFTHHSC